MRPVIRNICTAAGACVLAIAQTATAAPAWVVDNGDTRIVLVGSVHFLRAEDYPLPDIVDAEYDRADTLIMELDLDDTPASEIQALALALGTGENYGGLSSQLEPDELDSARSLASSIDIDLALLESLEPWLAAVTITSVRLAQLGYDPAFGVETYLVRRATADGKDVLGLETAEDQFVALDGLPAEEQAEFLLATLAEAAEADGDMASLVAAWRNADVEALSAELSSAMSEETALYDRIVVRRNESWAEKIERLAVAGGRYLVVVGALHLVGDDSLIALLKERGLDPSRLSDDP